LIDPAALVAHLGLAPHPEGGWYRETWRSPLQVVHPGHGGVRAACTTILYLLPPGGRSAWHRVASDEVWHLVQGRLTLTQLTAAGPHEVVLGTDLVGGEVAQVVVPAGVWQSATTVEGALCGCLVAPGFDFADFDLLPSGEVPSIR
jgi:hypothetical protein